MVGGRWHAVGGMLWVVGGMLQVAGGVLLVTGTHGQGELLVGHAVEVLALGRAGGDDPVLRLHPHLGDDLLLTVSLRCVLLLLVVHTASHRHRLTHSTAMSTPNKGQGRYSKPFNLLPSKSHNTMNTLQCQKQSIYI